LARIQKDRGGWQPQATLNRQDPGLIHVHGLGINPADGTLYAATHTGLFTVRDGAGQRVADRLQDTTGFTVVGPTTSWAAATPTSATSS